MDYEKAYKEALERARKFATDLPNGRNDRLYHVWDLESIFPELKESEDERIRKELLYFIQKEKEYVESQVKPDNSPKFRFLMEAIAWLEKQGKERKQLYIRFGDIPSNEKSKIYRGEDEIGDENGVSVYPAFELNGNVVLGLTLPITRSTLHTQQHLLEYDNRPCYLVTGNYVGKGIDGEPLIKNISIIKKLDNYRIKESEKQGEFYTKKDVDDAWLKGICDAKRELEKQGEQKSAWSEEDEKMWEKMLFLMKEENSIEYWEGCYEWLKSLKDRLKGE